MTVIKVKNSNVAGRLPAAGDLQPAELALNLADKKLYSKDVAGTVFEIGVAGDVPTGNTPPGTGNNNGDLFFDTSSNELKYWSGSAWETVTVEPATGSYVQDAGDTMTGQLTLPGGGTGNQAATIDEVNTAVANADYVSKTDTASQNIASDLTIGTNAVTFDATTGASVFGPQITIIRQGVNAMGLEINQDTTIPTISFGNSLNFFSGTAIVADMSAQGDLKLGTTDSIQLNASNGTASFVSTVNATQFETSDADPGNPFTYFNAVGYYANSDNANETFRLTAADGSASFSGQITAKGGVGLTRTTDDAVIGLLGTEPGENEIKLAGLGGVVSVLIGNDASDIYTTFQPSGITEFVNTMNIGSEPAPVPDSSVVAYNSSSTAATFYARNVASGPVFQAANTVGVNATIMGDGSAGFTFLSTTRNAGLSFTSGTYGPDTDTNITSRNLTGAGPASAPIVFGGLDASGAGYTEWARVTAAGIGFNLEPDNEDNYTTVTEEYTETEIYEGPLGNLLEREVTKTREVKTYTGPTLEVKEAIQELQQRVNDRDAVIADLTTRIAALEAA